MSLKRKWEEVGEHIVSAAVGDMVSRAIATVVDKVECRAEADDSEVDQLDRLVTMVSSAADAAEGVHIRSWWLRRWHWKLRDAACEGAAVVRSHRRRREAEETEDRSCTHACAASGPWWRWGGSVVLLLFRSATNLVFRGGAAALRNEVARMEETAASVGEFLKLLDIEIRRQEGSRDLRLSLMDAEVRDWEALPNIEQGCADNTRVAVAACSAIRPGLFSDQSRVLPVPAVLNEDEDANQSRSKPNFGHQFGGQLVAAVINEDDEVANQSRSKNMEGRIWVVMRLALGARVIWFALQIGSQMFRRCPTRPSPR